MVKIRKSFVSNSSSSSFICDVCGETFSGMDLSYGDVDCHTCVSGHIFCDEHMVGEVEDYITRGDVIEYLTDWKDDVVEEIKTMSSEEYEEWVEEYKDEYLYDLFNDELPEVCCPICSFKIITKDMLVDYITRETGITRADIFALIHAKNRRRKKVYDREYINYVSDILGVKPSDFEEYALAKFDSYEEFYAYANGRD